MMHQLPTFKCADCSHVSAYDAYSVRRGSSKAHCVKCGSTFLEPCSKLAKRIERRTKTKGSAFVR